MAIRTVINGFGRVGRLTFRQLMEKKEYDIVAVNDPAPVSISAYLLKYDTAQGRYPHHVEHDTHSLIVNGKPINYLQVINPDQLPWKNLNVDLVIDCSGAYLSREKAQKHLEAGAAKVVISSPAGEEVPSIVYGVNESASIREETILSAASCSTNALAPMVKYLHSITPVQSGMMLVIHAYTATQVLQDNAQKKGNLRRSRAAAENIIPTSAEAAKAVGQVIPELNGRLMGSAVRVPVPAGCLVTLTAVVKGNNVTEEMINRHMKEHQSNIFGYAEAEYVSSDIVGNSFASIFDPTQTMVCPINGNDEYEVRVAAWFDNENSFVSQMIRLIDYIYS